MSRILGLLRDALLVGVFGKTISDAWLAAFRFPNLFRRIFGEGALSACFIPLYVEYKEKGDHKSLSQLTVGVLTLLLVVLVPLNIVVILGIDWLMPLWVSGKGFSQVPGKMELTVSMTKIMFPFLLLVCLYAFFMAVLNAHKKFMMSALAPSLFNLTIILASSYCYWQNITSGTLLAWSVIVAGVVQFAVLIPPFLKLKMNYDFKWSYIRSTPVKKALNAFLPSVLGLGIVQFMGLINVNFASRLEEGSVTYVYLADRLLELPLSIIAVSLGTALLPTLSEKLTGAGNLEFNKELLKNLKILLFLCVPSAVGLWMVSKPLVEALFERGAFTSSESIIVTGIVQIYAFTLIAASVSRIMSQAFYAHKNTLHPAMASLTGLVVHLILAPQLMDYFGLYGLVASTAVAAFVNCVYLFLIYRWNFGSVFFTELLLFFIRCLVAAAAIVGVCWGVFEVLPTTHFMERVMALGVSVSLSIAAYFALSLVLRIQEAHVILKKIKKRF